ncbi:uncharacterized protein METZ01_LOCUS7297 [marine metagenome]|uniref:3-dehydroquinate synthase n=1 Tax=marine metagenome TaxID=408172 RepID=A0A381NLN7_9ZZZZ
MREFRKVKVNLGEKSYHIHIGKNIVDLLPEIISPSVTRKKIFLVSDEAVGSTILPRVRKILEDAGFELSIILVPSGEKSKSFEQLQILLSELLDNNIERRDIVIALGGGVIGDLVGFASSILYRGINFIQIPTTLLAQVDSSIGGKTAINVKQGKNLVGSFHQPKIVVADVNFLSTLSLREVKAGFAEIIKYAVLGNRAFFDWLNENSKKLLKLDTESLIHAIETSCKMKAKIVKEDEYEQGKRVLLNLGHTFGHAFEKSVNTNGDGISILHGEAIGIGICLAAKLSEDFEESNIEDSIAIEKLVTDFGLPTNILDISKNLKISEVIKFMKHDKKRSDDKNTLILLKGIGRAFIHNDVKDEDLARFLNNQGLKK